MKDFSVKSSLADFFCPLIGERVINGHRLTGLEK